MSKFKYSRILNNLELKGINKMGDLMIPSSDDFPSFSELGCIEHIDTVLEYAPDEETADLKMLLKVLGLSPEPFLKLLIKFMMNNKPLPEFIASILRLVDTGMRGIIFTLYYSGKKGKDYNGLTPLEIIGFELNRIPLEN